MRVCVTQKRCSRRFSFDAGHLKHESVVQLSRLSHKLSHSLVVRQHRDFQRFSARNKWGVSVNGCYYHVKRMRGSTLAVCQPENLRDILQGVNPVCEKERKHVKRFYVGRGKTFNTLLNGWVIHIKLSLIHISEPTR